MRPTIIFTVVLLCNSALLWSVYYLTSAGLAIFDVIPSSGDTDAVYLPLTAFGYVSQITASVILFVLLNWQLSKAFPPPTPRDLPLLKKLPREVRKIIQAVRVLLHENMFYWSYFIMVYCVFVFANKIDWTLRLLFDADRYGYYTTRPATSSVIIALSCLGLIYASIWQTSSAKVARRYTILCSGLVLVLACAAFAHVARAIH